MSIFRKAKSEKMINARAIAKAQAESTKAEGKVGKPPKKQKAPSPSVKKDGAITLDELLFYDIVDDD